MPGLPIEVVIKMLKDYIKKYRSPFPVPAETYYKWAEGLGIAKGGKTVLYTGGLYQLVPYIEKVVGRLEGLEKRRGSGILLKMGRTLSKFVNLTDLVTRVPESKLEKYYNVLRDITFLLKASGAEFGYLYEDDMYSGALLYELGLEDEFKEHAVTVYEKFKKLGVRKLITVDPHTTHIVRSIYPQFIEGFNIEVESYLEILYERGIEPSMLIHRSVVLHDSCLYCRYENVIKQPRELLKMAGVKLLEPDRSGRLTYCCGGPIEVLSPSLSKRIARERVEELSSISSEIVACCPICMANLSRASDGEVSIEDISAYLSQAYRRER